MSGTLLKAIVCKSCGGLHDLYLRGEFSMRRSSILSSARRLHLPWQQSAC